MSASANSSPALSDEQHLTSRSSRSLARFASAGALALVLLAGCVTNQEPGLRAAGTSTILNAHPHKARSAVVSGEDAFTAPTVIAAPIDSVWHALLRALPATGVPVDAVHPASYTAGTTLTSARRKFAGKPISTYPRELRKSRTNTS